MAFKKGDILVTKDGLLTKVIDVLDGEVLRLTKPSKQVVDYYGFTANKFLIKGLELEPMKKGKTTEAPKEKDVDVKVEDTETKDIKSEDTEAPEKE